MAGSKMDPIAEAREYMLGRYPHKPACPDPPGCAITSCRYESIEFSNSWTTALLAPCF